MAQYYQVTSLEELRRLYPNLQLDNDEGTQCMIQDEQLTQYTDGQGQQIIATVEQSVTQMQQNSAISQQCGTQQSHFVVHQPTQYVIQQMEPSESQKAAIRYKQQSHPVSQKEGKNHEIQYADQKLGYIGNEAGNKEHSLTQHTVQQEGGQHFVPQVQPVLRQPVQIHQQLQTVEMGPNILVLQNQEHQDMSQNVLISQNKRQELISNQVQQDKQQHIIIQRHQQQKPQHMISQGQPVIQKDQNSQQYVEHQILLSRRPSQDGGQQQQILHQPQQQIIQPLQYYNQVTVIDSFSQPNVTIEHHSVSNEELGHHQMQHDGPQSLNQLEYKSKENNAQAGSPTIIQQSQTVIPQRFEMSSPPPLTARIPQSRKKAQQDLETSPSPVFIVQKLDSPFLIRQPPTKIRFQNPQLKNEKINENSFQTTTTQLEPGPESIPQDNSQMMQAQPRPAQQIEIQQKINPTGLQTQQVHVSKFAPDRNQTSGQVKIGIVGQPFVGRVAEQVNKSKPPPAILTKSPVGRIKTSEQQTDALAVGDTREINSQHYERFISNIQVQSQASSTPQPQQMQPMPQSQPQGQVQNQIQISGRGIGRGIRGGHCPPFPRGGHQFVPRARGVQVQTSPPRPPNAEGVRKLKSPRGGNRGGRGAWVPCGLDQRQSSTVRPGTSQIIQAVPTNGDTNQGANENVEETRMLVLVLNDEKKMVRIPCSQQNIHLGQILQQAGLSLTSPTSVAIEQVLDISNSDQFIIKNNAVNTQQQAILHKPAIFTQAGTIPNSGGSSRGIVATIHQQRPRGQPPNIGIIRHRLQFASPRITAPTSVQQNVMSSNVTLESGSPQPQANQSTKSAAPPQKEEPRFVSGFMAICPFCGISSLDFNKCIRCRRKLPENVKSQSIFNAKKKKPEKAGATHEKNSDESKTDLEEKQSDAINSDDKEKASLLCDRKKPKPCLKKKKINDEPAEILILSSDEEEEVKIKKTDTIQQPLTVLRKEPVYVATELSERDMELLMKEGNLSEDLMKNVQPGSFTTLQCRTIRVGSYKVQPKERVLISPKGIRIVINSLKNENSAIVIPVTNILKILIHFGKQIPVVFIYPAPKVGFQIRNVLGMDNKMGPYYDPTSTQEETHKRITLLLEKITEDNKIILHKIFEPGKLEELSEKEANEILIRTSPVEMQNSGLVRLTDSVRKIMVYPPPPEKGGITLNNQDYACLGEDQFLNDVIIDFYLKYLLLKVLSPADRNRTHVFSTFFYKRLTTKPKTMRKNDPENDPKLSPAEKRHMRVKGWTKQVNLFEKDFVIVPINEHSHWFLAIICFPGLTGPVRFADNMPVEPEEVAPKKSTQTVQIGNTTITHIIKSEGNAISLEMDSSSDRDEAEGDQDDLHPSSDDDEGEQVEEDSNASSAVQIPLLAPIPQSPPNLKDSKIKPFKRKPFKEPIKQPCILIFDSLAGASRVRVVATLRDYLKIEYKKKMGQDRDFSKDTIKGAVPKVPQQNNFTDCGLYVLQYVESFFQDPLHDFKLPLKYLQDWFPEEVVSCKRQQLACLIRTLMEEQGIRVEEIGLPVLTFANGNNVMDDQCRIEDEDEEDEEDEEINEEDEEMLRKRMQISDFENEEEVDMDLGEEEEDDEDEDEDLLEEDDDDDDEELEAGEISRRWITKSKNLNETQSSVEHVDEHVLIKTSSLVDYDPSESDEDCSSLSRTSEVVGQDQSQIHTEISEEAEYHETEQSLHAERRKSVPLTDLQDFESQITCTTIERNFDSKNSESDMVVSDEEEEEEEEECGGLMENEETALETSGVENAVGLTQSFNESVPVESRHSQSNDTLVKDSKSIEVTNIIKKLVNDKNITISRKEDDLKSNLLKKQLDIKRFKVKDCDKSEEVKKIVSSCGAAKNNLATFKRSSQALKSVRIPKKAERLEISNKRQKIDEM